MKVVVLTNKSLKKELVSDVEEMKDGIIWIETLSQLDLYKETDAVIDLLYEASHQTILEHLLPAVIIINSVEQTLAESNGAFVRINGWNTFLQSSLVEASSVEDANKVKAEEIFSLFNKTIEWVKDEVGFITPKVVAMIINEAFIALNQGVSTKEEMNTAMKLGTNYPYGPFEWADKIGGDKIKSLLNKLSKQHDRYTSFVE